MQIVGPVPGAIPKLTYNLEDEDGSPIASFSLREMGRNTYDSYNALWDRMWDQASKAHRINLAFRQAAELAKLMERLQKLEARDVADPARTALRDEIAKLQRDIADGEPPSRTEFEACRRAAQSAKEQVFMLILRKGKDPGGNPITVDAEFLNQYVFAYRSLPEQILDVQKKLNHPADEFLSVGEQLDRIRRLDLPPPPASPGIPVSGRLPELSESLTSG